MTINVETNHRHKPTVLLGVALIFVGFTSLMLYMGSTIMYPLLQFDKFVTLALHNDAKQLLADRYVGYLPIFIFGIISVIAGNWLWYSKKKIDSSGIAMISMPVFILFAILMMKPI